MQPIQERERFLVLKKSTHLGPVRTLESRQAPRDLLLCPRPIVELTVWSKEIERRRHPLPSRFDLLVGLESSIGLRPGFVALACQLSLSAALPSSSFESAICCFGLVPSAFYARPGNTECLLRRLLGMEDIQSLLDRGLAGRTLVCLQLRNSRLQSSAGVRGDVPQRIPGRQLCKPR